ncbi:hypothetical protein [Marinobacter sp. 2_MG-2023]|uniref:hypothetical protein n=1 Tax=Marinobacter sp. 2_MG-2023 TaxID=3062679 RepID=UPI0026E2EAC3|nr:hypothetical protein [Marinobacter sp. 2_MG-2023]MDO6442733.1 hypothetical protein [Marinobacter sp. 2_MG-2023]
MRHAFLCLLAAGLAVPTASAVEISNSDNHELNADLELAAGIFKSDKNYLYDSDRGGATWQEGYFKYGLSGNYSLGKNASIYGSVSAVSSGTFGEGDAGGFSTGDERNTDLEDAYIGFKSGDYLPFLGHNGLDVSFGSQNFAIGDGFLINGDALNFGEGLNGGGFDFDRGGAYWLAARKAFDKTALVRIGGNTGLRSDLFWVESDNNAQADTELTGINLEYVSRNGTFGLMHLKGLGVNDRYAQALGLTARDGQDTTSFRYQGNAGVEPLFLSAEFVTQGQGDTSREDARAWYMEAGWSFSEQSWSPSVNIRYSTFEEDFDPLFFGFNRGYGTWFQGEVAANYAGPFNSDTDVLHLGIKAYPSPTVAIGALFFDFSDTAQGSGTLDSQEFDLYAEWAVNDHLFLSPLIGFFKPENRGADGGSQLQDNDLNTYAQIMAVIAF